MKLAQPSSSAPVSPTVNEHAEFKPPRLEQQHIPPVGLQTTN